MQEQPWLLLIYSVPSNPSRKRAYVWRELKRLGAIYLRDGVAVLPDRPDLAVALGAIAERIREYDGEADVLPVSAFSPARQQELFERLRAERAAEYREIHHACVGFLRDVLSDVSADEFGFPDVDKLESELHRLERWFEQVRGRDYLRAEGSRTVADIMEKCETAFERFVATAVERSDRPDREPAEDVYQYLGGPAGEAKDDLPL